MTTNLIAATTTYSADAFDWVGGLSTSARNTIGGLFITAGVILAFFVFAKTKGGIAGAVSVFLAGLTFGLLVLNAGDVQDELKDTFDGNNPAPDPGQVGMTYSGPTDALSDYRASTEPRA